MTKHYDDQFSVSRGFSRTESNGSYLDGEVATRHGFCTVYSQGGVRPGDAFSRIDFVFNGTLHARNFTRRYTKRGLSMLAKRFTVEIVNKHA